MQRVARHGDAVAPGWPPLRTIVQSTRRSCQAQRECHGEGGIRTLERGHPRYAISSRARSTAPAPLHDSALQAAPLRLRHARREGFQTATSSRLARRPAPGARRPLQAPGSRVARASGLPSASIAANAPHQPHGCAPLSRRALAGLRARGGPGRRTTLSGSAPVAQLDRASVYGTEGREFESLRAR